MGRSQFLPYNNGEKGEEKVLAIAERLGDRGTTSFEVVLTPDPLSLIHAVRGR